MARPNRPACGRGRPAGGAGLRRVGPRAAVFKSRNSIQSFDTNGAIVRTFTSHISWKHPLSLKYLDCTPVWISTSERRSLRFLFNSRDFGIRKVLKILPAAAYVINIYIDN